MILRAESVCVISCRAVAQHPRTARNGVWGPQYGRKDCARRWWGASAHRKPDGWLEKADGSRRDDDAWVCGLLMCLKACHSSCHSSCASALLNSLELLWLGRTCHQGLSKRFCRGFETARWSCFGS